MVSLTFSLDEKSFARMSRFSWVNWSEVARVETTKREIFERYIRKGELTDEDWKFCEAHDWHPVDRLPLKKEFVAKLKAVKREKSIRVKSVDDIFR
jgi:hypothetical protein